MLSQTFDAGLLFRVNSDDPVSVADEFIFKPSVTQRRRETLSYNTPRRGREFVSDLFVYLRLVAPRGNIPFTENIDDFGLFQIRHLPRLSPDPVLFVVSLRSSSNMANPSSPLHMESLPGPVLVKRGIAKYPIVEKSRVSPPLTTQGYHLCSLASHAFVFLARRLLTS